MFRSARSSQVKPHRPAHPPRARCLGSSPARRTGETATSSTSSPPPRAVRGRAPWSKRPQFSQAFNPFSRQLHTHPCTPPDARASPMEPDAMGIQPSLASMARAVSVCAAHSPLGPLCVQACCPALGTWSAPPARTEAYLTLHRALSAPQRSLMFENRGRRLNPSHMRAWSAWDVPTNERLNRSGGGDNLKCTGLPQNSQLGPAV